MSSPPSSELRIAPRIARDKGACPTSATHYAINSVGLVGLLVALYVLHGRTGIDNQNRVLIVMAATALPIGLLDLLLLKVHRRESTGLDWDKRFDPDLRRIATKLLGLGITVGVIGIAFWLFPEYHEGFIGKRDFYSGWFSLFRRFWAPLTSIAIFYVGLVDGHMREPRDAYWQIGRWALGHGEDVVRKDVANHARGWLVKAFFLPLMMSYLHDSTAKILDWNLEGATFENLRLYDFLYDGSFLIDLAFTTIGYILSIRITDSHLRTAEPTMLGWIVALFCYQPFFSLMDRQYVSYGGADFRGMLAAHPTAKVAWAVAILALVVIYVLATVAFGWRFSNLTHRGILTNGPYRFTKHPAYISKNLSWWLSSVPFAIHGPVPDVARRCVCLFLINVIYFLRARTEERHLSRDPTYVAYALWMNEHGTFRWLGRVIPFFRYTPPDTAPVAAPAATREAA